jgi:hypothetical protein
VTIVRAKVYFGKVCPKHPEFEGERFRASRNCVECNRMSAAAWTAKNADYDRARCRDWFTKNQEYNRQRCRERYVANREHEIVMRRKRRERSRNEEAAQ